MKKIEDNIFEIEVEDIKETFSIRDKNSNKGDFGTVGIMGGCIDYSGAIKLANRSFCALRAGCGIARVIVPSAIKEAILPHLLEQTLFLIDSDEYGHMIYNKQKIKEALYKLNVISFGMGLGNGEDNKKILEEILQVFSGTVILDADGLNTLSNMDIEILNKTNAKVVLTPHLKEFERLSKINLETIKNDSINIAIEFAKKYNVILLLKGSTTIVTDGNITYLVKRGCAGMATAGSGDVLSGVLSGTLGYKETSALSVAACAYLAGLAGELAQEQYSDISMTSSGTIEFIPEAIKYIRECKNNLVEIEDFNKIDIRVGTIVDASINKGAKKSAYKLKIDFGEYIGIKMSSAQITELYTTEELIGKQVIAVTNFKPVRISQVKSEVLVLGIDSKNGVILLEPNKEARNGSKVY